MIEAWALWLVLVIGIVGVLILGGLLIWALRRRPAAPASVATGPTHGPQVTGFHGDEEREEGDDAETVAERVKKVRIKLRDAQQRFLEVSEQADEVRDAGHPDPNLEADVEARGRTVERLQARLDRLRAHARLVHPDYFRRRR